MHRPQYDAPVLIYGGLVRFNVFGVLVADAFDFGVAQLGIRF